MFWSSDGVRPAKRSPDAWRRRDARSPSSRDQHRCTGGSCINIACVPTKDLIDSASKRDGRDPASYFTSAVADRDTLIATLNRTNHAMLEGKVLLLDGVASFTGPHTVKVVAGDDEITVRAETIIVNTGSHPANLPVPGADGP